MPLNSDTSRVAPGTAQFASTCSTTLCVPQGTYAISKRNHDRVTGLTTGRVSSCMALAGVNKKTGVAFLAHFDTPIMAHGVDMLVKDVKEANGGTLDGFVIYDLTGIPPRHTFIVLLLGVLILLLSLSLCSLFQICTTGFFLVSSALIIFGVFYSSTRIWLYMRLRHLDAFQGEWIKRRPLNIFQCFLKKDSTALINIEPTGEVITSIDPGKDDEHFKVPQFSKSKRIWRIHRAPGSLSPQEALNQ